MLILAASSTLKVGERRFGRIARFIPFCQHNLNIALSQLEMHYKLIWLGYHDVNYSTNPSSTLLRNTFSRSDPLTTCRTFRVNDDSKKLYLAHLNLTYTFNSKIKEFPEILMRCYLFIYYSKISKCHPSSHQWWWVQGFKNIPRKIAEMLSF